MLRRSIATDLACGLVLAFTSTACKTPAKSDSTTESLAVVPIVLTIAGTLVDNFIEFNLEKQWDYLYDHFLTKEKNLGDLTAVELSTTSKALKTNLPAGYQRTLSVKLNSLQQTMGRDYVAGAPDSSNVLSIMLDKSNDIASGLREYINRDANPSYAGYAIATYQQYLLVSSLNLVILKERAENASRDKATSPEVIKKLKAAVVQAARDHAAHIQILVGPTLQDYARTKYFKYSTKVLPEVVDFGIAKNVAYQNCMTDMNGVETCAAPSKTRCANDLAADCDAKAQQEAKASFNAASIEKDAVLQVRKQLFAIDLDAFAARMIEQANQFAAR